MGRPRGNTREKLVAAGYEALRTVGYARASSRAIGKAAGVNPALVFYYFESVDDLLVTALSESNADRLARYRESVESARSPSDLLAALARIYQDDVAAGHVTVVSELVAASVSRPELAAQVTALMEPWVELAEAAVEAVLVDSPLRDVASPRAIALAGVMFYLGANLLTQLMPASADVEGLFAEAYRVAPLLDSLVLPGSADP